jgi:triphosphatase
MRRTRNQISCRFELDPQNCDWLLANLVAVGAQATDETKDFALYLDTPEAAIGNHGLALGMHRAGELSSDDVKTAVAKATRGQGAPRGWTRFIEPLSAATPVGARRWLQSFLRRRNTKQSVSFQIETRCSRLRLDKDGAETEISLERARITANRKQALFAILNFTCESGSGDFFRWVADVCDPAKLRMSSEELALRGYRFCGNLRDSHVTAFAPKLVANMDVTTAFRNIARACFDQFLLNEAAIRLRRDREAVHQCRVALRRLSTSLRLFSSLVSGGGLDDLRPDLHQLATHLQKARDLDVVIADAIAPAIGVDPPDPAKELMHVIEGRRNSAYDELIVALSAPQTAKLFFRLVAWIEAGDWTFDPEGEAVRREKIGTFVERKLAKASRKFKERYDKLEEADQEERHRIRIRAKNLRYSAEFFETLVVPKATHDKKAAYRRFRAFISALKDLQTVLGRENDVRMARRFLTSLTQEIERGLVADMGTAALATIQSVAARIEGLPEAEFQKKAERARHALGKAKPFWSEICKAEV